jgi:hypothetical protein
MAQARNVAPHVQAALGIAHARLATTRQPPAAPVQAGFQPALQGRMHAPAIHRPEAPRRLDAGPALAKPAAVHPAHRPAVIQNKFVTSRAFARSGANEMLNGIKAYLETNDEEFRWAIRSRDFTVSFDVGNLVNTEDSYGNTQLLLGDTDLGAAIMRSSSAVADLLRRPQPLTVKITIDRSVMDNEGMSYIALAHEIGVHVKPRLAFIRKVVESGGITERELGELLGIISREHSDVYHHRSALSTLPTNQTYGSLVMAFASLIQDVQARQTFLETYFADVERYGNDDEDFIVRMRSRQIAQQEALRRAGVFCGSVSALLVVIAAILLVSRLF